ncbi:hypothetical protein [Microbacterium dauci]|uniref:Integral membrane protein n=1 Tax=Microbacterium dauci TaxID=3048008 RepID=A0ABT6ZA75_9MICO|nr:hypothetical protein [Microbacterium sp. LX3-4]MDJ1113058.1 hypothetical protein [Microbacterium sp. LX3-4]
MDPRPADTRSVRVVRAGAASMVATLVAAVAHTFSGGEAPPAWLMLAVATLAWPIALVLVGRRPSLLRTAAAVAAAQALLHTAFAMVGTRAPDGFTAHVHHGAPLVLGPGGAIDVDTAMVIGHVAAAAVTTVLLCHGERMLRAIGRGIRSALPVTTHAVLAPVALPRLANVTAEPTPLPALRSGLSRRGPPR